MKGFINFTNRRRERRQALHETYRLIASVSDHLNPAQTETLFKAALAVWASGEITDIVNRHLNPEEVIRTLGHSKEKR